MELGSLLPVAAVLLLVVAAGFDVARFEIPDWPAAALLSLAVAYVAPMASGDWALHLASAAAMLAFGTLAFARGWLGGGDVKLMVAVAAWVPLAGLPALFVGIALAGGALALALMAARRLMPAAAPRALLSPEAPLPYGVAIAAGAGWVLLG